MYFVTAISYDYPKGDVRCFGYFKTFNDFSNHVAKHGLDDLYEYYYQYLVIEHYGDGIYAECEEVGWFEWKGKFVSCEKPEFLKGIVHFAIG